MIHHTTTCEELVNKEPFIETKYFPPWKMKLVEDYFLDFKSNFTSGNVTGITYFERVCMSFKNLLNYFSLNHVPKDVISSLLNQKFKRILGEKESTHKNKTLLTENYIVRLMAEIMEKKRAEIELTESQHKLFQESLQEVAKQQNTSLNELGLSENQLDSGTIPNISLSLNSSVQVPRMSRPLDSDEYSVGEAEAAAEWFMSKRVLQLKVRSLETVLSICQGQNNPLLFVIAGSRAH